MSGASDCPEKEGDFGEIRAVIVLDYHDRGDQETYFEVLDYVEVKHGIFLSIVSVPVQVGRCVFRHDATIGTGAQCTS